MKEIQPAAIVVRAEIESAIPGLSDFCASIKPAIQRSLKAKIEAWNVARMIFQFSQRTEVHLQVDLYNNPNGKRKEGTPKKAHRYVADELVRFGIIGRDTSYRWLNEWTKVAAKAGLSPGCSETEFSLISDETQDLAKTIERLTQDDEFALKPTDGDENPEKKADAFIQKIQSFCEIKGSDGITKFSIARFNMVVKKIAPLTPRKADAGKLPKPPQELLTRADGKDAPNSAQKAYESIIEKNPLPYAKKLAETAARRGFGENDADVPTALRSAVSDYMQSQGDGPLSGKRALSEDVHVVKRMKQGDTTDRKRYLEDIAATLRTGAKNDDVIHANDGLLHYYDKKRNWIALVKADQADVITGFPLRGETWTEYQKRKERKP